jgi:AraC family transcriptional regulator, L-rhamnose operon transcriptional activator RhaR
MVNDPVLLARARLFPPHGLPIHVNRPVHDGEVPLHHHDFLEIAVVYSGHAMHRTILGVQPVGPGDVIVLRPGHWHAYERCHGLHLANCILGDEVLGGPLAWARESAVLAPFLGLGKTEGPVQLHLEDAALSRVIAALEVLRTQQGGSGHDLALVGHLLIALDELATAIGAGAIASSAPHPVVVACIARLRADVAAPWTLEGLAAHVQVTPSYLVRLFRRFTGHTPMEWLARQRLEQVAILLLTTDLTLTAIAQRVGWMDATHLVRRFRAYAGQTPGAYRRQLPVAPVTVLTEDWIQW